MHILLLFLGYFSIINNWDLNGESVRDGAFQPLSRRVSLTK